MSIIVSSIFVRAIGGITFVATILALIGVLRFAWKTAISDEKRRLSETAETEDFKFRHARLDSPGTMPLPDVNLRIDIDEDAAEKPEISNRQIKINTLKTFLKLLLVLAFLYLFAHWIADILGMDPRCIGRTHRQGLDCTLGD